MDTTPIVDPDDKGMFVSSHTHVEAGAELNVHPSKPGQLTEFLNAPEIVGNGGGDMWKVRSTKKALLWVDPAEKRHIFASYYKWVCVAQGESTPPTVSPSDKEKGSSYLQDRM